MDEGMERIRRGREVIGGESVLFGHRLDARFEDKECAQ